MQNEDPSTHDAQTLDSATADQAKEQEKAHFPEMHSDGDDDGEDEGEEEMKSALLEENDELSVSDAILQSNMSCHEGNQGRRFEIPEVSLPVGFWSLRIEVFPIMLSVAFAVCLKCYFKRGAVYLLKNGMVKKKVTVELMLCVTDLLTL